MKTITASEFKNKLSSIIKQTISGDSFEVVDDKTRTVIGYFTNQYSKHNKIESKNSEDNQVALRADQA